MDIQSILVSVEERDKWSRRLDTLRDSLADVRLRRQQLERRLRALKRELAHLAEIPNRIVDPARLRGVTAVHGGEEGRFPH